MDIDHRIKRISLIFLLLLFWMPNVAAEILVDSRNVTSSVRVSRTDVQFTNTLNLSNTAGSFTEVVITVTSNSANTVIVDNQIIVGNYLTTDNMTTTDTFSFRQNRRVAFDPSALQYHIDLIFNMLYFSVTYRHSNSIFQ